MTKKKKVKIEWIIIGILIILAIILLKKVKKYNKIEESYTNDLEITQKDIVLQDYVELEKSYDKALKEIESALEENQDMSLEILQQNLKDILTEIKKEKEIIKKKHVFAQNDSLLDYDRTKQYKDLLDVSKEVLIQRLAEAEALNQQLQENNQKLKKNLEDANQHIEKEKIKNAKLKENLININEKIAELEKAGNEANVELQILKRERKEYMARLEESNEQLEFQNYQLKELGEILKKITVDCYFIYEKGNVEEEAKIFLTKEGISKRYLKYFLRSKPDVYVEFMINKEVFDKGNQKIEVILYNSKHIEVYRTVKSVSKEQFKIVLPNKHLKPGTYYLKIKSGDKDLLINGEYEFKIGLINTL